GGPSVIGYVGVPGALVALPYRGGLSTSTDRPASFTRTMGGKRKALMGARGRREWDVSFDLVGSRAVAGLVVVARSDVSWLWVRVMLRVWSMWRVRLER